MVNYYAVSSHCKVTNLDFLRRHGFDLEGVGGGGGREGHEDGDRLHGHDCWMELDDRA